MAQLCSNCVKFVVSVSGLGYGIISGLFAMVNVLADITGPGSLGLQGDPQNFLIVSGKLHVSLIDVSLELRDPGGVCVVFAQF